MNEGYGITLTRNAIIRRVKESELYYDKILDYIYKDYETYYWDM